MAKKRGNGEGTVPYRRNNGRWCAQYTVYAPQGRKRRTLYGKTRQEVATKLAKALSDWEDGLAFNVGSLTVGEWIDRWLEDCLNPLVQLGKMVHNTFVRYVVRVDNHINL